jgi:hypothetical protein
VFVSDPNHKGNVAEAAIAAAAIKLGVDVIKPLVEHTRYDLIFDPEAAPAARTVQVGATEGRRDHRAPRELSLHQRR